MPAARDGSRFPTNHRADCRDSDQPAALRYVPLPKPMDRSIQRVCPRRGRSRHRDHPAAVQKKAFSDDR
jgi:hypothetical protein